MSNIRPATEFDAPILPEIERSAGTAFHDIPDLAWISEGTVQAVEAHKAFARAGTAWVIVDGLGRPFGFLTAERFGSELHIWEIAVRREDQGQGSGRALVEAAIAHARATRLTALTLTTFRDVPWNAPLYAHLGFDTLAPEELGERLSAVLANERANGLPGERRCAMRLACMLSR